MDYYLKLVTKPAAEPLSVAEVKVDRGMDAADAKFDLALTLLIVAARRRAERITSRLLIEQTWDMRYIKGFPSTAQGSYVHSASEIRIPRMPLKATGGITHVKYLDSNGVQQTLTAGTDYIVGADSEPAFVDVAYGKSWPTVRSWVNASGQYPIELRFIAGYGPAASNVPEDIRKAMLIIVGSWFEVREELTDADSMPIPSAALAILQEYIFSPR